MMLKAKPASSSAFYLHVDHLNTPRLATNQAGDKAGDGNSMPLESAMR